MKKSMWKVLNFIFMNTEASEFFSHKLSEVKHIDGSVEEEVKKIITDFQLQAHPEGRYYVRSFESEFEVKSVDKNRYQDESRYAGTAIFYLLKGQHFLHGID